MTMSSKEAIAVQQVGVKAYNALHRSGGRAEPISALGKSGYHLADGEIIWIGSKRHAMHPRAVLIDEADLPRKCLNVTGCSPWHPAPMPSAAPSVLRTNACRLRAVIKRVGEPKGFGALLIGNEPEFPLSLGTPNIRAFAAVIGGCDPHFAAMAALPLLGLGPGLTPSGDDLVGAAFFGRRLTLGDKLAADAWDAAARMLASETKRRSNAVSAALFADLAEHRSFAELHRLSCTLCESAASDDDIAAAVRGLAAIGHSSGWDMLTGFIVGVTGSVDGSPQCEGSS